METPSSVRRILKNIAHHVSRSRSLARLLFGVKFLRVPKDYYYFDTTTYATTRLVSKILRRDNRVVDMGTGTAAVVGLFLWRKIGCSVVSVDINPTMVQMSRESVRFNGAPIQVIESEFFAKVPGEFDTVIFNPPYVHTDIGETRRLSQATRSQWDGGRDGMRVIDGFLAAVSTLSHPVTVYMGINDWHVPRQTILESIGRRANLILNEVAKPSILPVFVYVFQNRKSADTV
jgi:methylase of polypeptide subunit release factors